MKRVVWAAGLVFATAAVAQSGGGAPGAGRVAAGDPAVPPALRQGAQSASPSGRDLDALVEQKLRQRFDAADTSGSGRITRAQAAAAGWGAIAQQFDRIDATGSGSVSFEEIRRYLRANARR